MCSFARASFYAIIYPLWEGYDEWSHYAVIETGALNDRWLVDRSHLVSRRVEESLKLAPVPWELRSLPFPSLTYAEFWRLPAEIRLSREKAFERLSKVEGSDGNLTAYEALQPPLYYWVMRPFFLLFRPLSLGASVIFLRLVSCVLAVFTLPFVYLTARDILKSEPVALGCTTIVALMPEFSIDVARIGNESVAVPIFAILIWLAISGRRQTLLGCVLGFGLLAKAYFLTAIPALLFRSRTMLVAAAISGWWFVRNMILTGTISGLSEAVTLRHLTMFEFLKRAAHTNFASASDAILLSHLWFGGWSSLTVRSWMYHVFYALILLAVAGLASLRFRGFEVIGLIYALFWMGELYNAAMIFVSKNVSTSMGWYMYAVVSAEVVLCCGGLRAIAPKYLVSWVAPTGAILFALLDLYTVHAVSLPYYTGVVEHGQSFHLNTPMHLERLLAFKGAFGCKAIMWLAWAGYIAGTATLLWLAVGFGRRQEHPPRDQRAAAA